MVEYRVNVCGTNDGEVFQTWIGDQRSPQDITYAYDTGAMPNDPAGQDYLVGAENALGQGQFLPIGTLPTTDLLVTSTASTPAESLSDTVSVLGGSRGSGAFETSMSAPTLLGATIVRSGVDVN